MLVLTRKPDESIHIGQNVIVKVQSVYGNRVVLGIAAPSEVGIHREEVYERIVMQTTTAVDSQVEIQPPTLIAAT